MIDREGIYEELNAERNRQLDKWGPQSWPMVREEEVQGGPRVSREQRIAFRHCLQTEETYKKRCDQRTDQGVLSWADILLEELAEAIYAKYPGHVREELVQLGAVVVAAIEDLDKKRNMT